MHCFKCVCATGLLMKCDRGGPGPESVKNWEIGVDARPGLDDAHWDSLPNEYYK